MIPNITGICNKPLTAIISPKSVPVALTIKLLTVKVRPDVKASKHPIAKFNLALRCSSLSSSADSIVSSTVKI